MQGKRNRFAMLAATPQTTSSSPDRGATSRCGETGPRCIVCREVGLELAGPYGYRSEAFRVVAPNLGLLRCPSCELLQVDRDGITDAALDAYYRTSYRGEAGIGVSRSERDLAWFEARARALATLASRWLPQREGSRLFELGAGYGYNLDALGDAFPGSTTHTDEIDAGATEQGAATRGRSHAAAKLLDGSWDLVLLSHVLEHFLDPLAQLLAVHGSLATNGICVIEVPNEEQTMLARHGFLEPHLSFFRLQSFRRFLEMPAISERFELLELGSAGPLIAPQPLGLAERGARLARRWARRARLVRNGYRFDFANDAPDGKRIFLRAALRAR